MDERSEIIAKASDGRLERAVDTMLNRYDELTTDERFLLAECIRLEITIQDVDAARATEREKE